MTKLEIFDGIFTFSENFKEDNIKDVAGDNRICKVYLLTNKINGKIYVGQTWLEFYQRMGGDKGHGYQNSPYLYHAINHYGGAKNFEYHILRECETQEEADFYETKYIQSYNSDNLEIGYNLKKEGGSHGKHSTETITKMSKTMSEKEWSQEALEGKANAGRQWKGKKRGPHTQQWKEDNSKRMEEWHTNNEHPMLGQHHTDETKESMRQKLKGRKKDPEEVKKAAEKRRWSKETMDKAIIAYYDWMPWKEIHKNFGIPPTTLSRNLVERGLPTRGR